LRILILVDCYLPSYKSGAKLIHDLGVEFLQQGHQVMILAPTNQITQDFEVSIEDGLCVARVRTPQIKGASKPLRGLHEARLSSLVWQRAGKFLREHPADLIVFYSPTIFWGALVGRLKSLWHVPSYLILRDIFPDWAVDAGLLRRGLIYNYFRRKALQQYSNADIIAVQSTGDLKRFGPSQTQPAYRLKVLRNWTALREPDLPNTQYRVQFGLQNKVVFFYGGNLGVAQDVDNIIRLASSLADHPEIHFLLVGEGSSVPRLQKAIAEKGLRNVLLAPPVEQRQYLSMVSEFDVGLISLDRRLTNHNIPGKLLSYLFSGIPVLASVNPGSDLFEIIGKNSVGLCIGNGEDEALRDAAMQLSNDARLRAEMGNNARLLLETTFSVHSAVTQIVQAVSELPRAGS
jgi:glycosyltransferase involved in cell wall biosynthesis